MQIFLLKESNSGHNKYILVTEYQFLPQEINSSQKNLLFLVKLALSTWGRRESYQNFCLILHISWEPGSQIPREYAALVMTISQAQNPD